MRWLIRGLISGIIFALFMYHVGVRPFSALERVENYTYDARVNLNLLNSVDERIIIVDIDERTLSEVGQWPIRRDKFAGFVDTMFDHYNIRALAFDIVFSEPDAQSGAKFIEELRDTEFGQLQGFDAVSEKLKTSLDSDQIFADSLKGRNVVMGYVFKDTVPETDLVTLGALGPAIFDEETTDALPLSYRQPVGYTGNLPLLQNASGLGGFFDNPLVDSDGVFRRVPLLQKYNDKVYPSLALALTRAALGDAKISLQFDPPNSRDPLALERLKVGPLSAPVDGNVAVWVPYRGNYRSFQYIPMVDVINKSAPKEIFSGAIVLVGTTAPGLLDFRSTPVNKIFPGVEVHANIVSGLLDQRVRQKAPYYVGIEVVMLITVLLIITLLLPKVSALASAAILAVIIGGVIGLALWTWNSFNFIIPMGLPIVFALTLFLAHTVYSFFVESRNKREISKLFGQYVPPELVEEMALHPDMVSMEGETREMTVLFSDVRGFTSISEKLQARELSEMMNQFLTPQTNVIQQHRGTIDKYMGDAIMAFWGAPLPDSDHALNAVTAGMAMLASVEKVNPSFIARGWPPIAIGVGVNTGSMRVGNMGSEFRMAYTVMGDPVNLGSRLEGLTKEYGVGLIISEYTRNLLPSEWAFRELDSVRVKGKNEPVNIFEPMGQKDNLDPGLRTDLARHRGAMKLYREQRWDESEMEFVRLSQGERPHKIYDLFIKRIAVLRQNPPGADWDGAFTFQTK